MYPRNPGYVSALPARPVGPGLTFHHIQRVSQGRGPASGHGFVMWSGSPSDLHGEEGHLSQPQSQVLCPDSRGPRVGIRDSEKSGPQAAQAVIGNSRYLLKTPSVRAGSYSSILSFQS